MFVVFGAFAVFLVVIAFTGGDSSPPPRFTAFWLAALGWNAYWFLFRVAVQLTLDADSIEAQTPLGQRRVALQDLTAIRPMKLASNVAVIEVSGERPVVTMVAKGFHEFTSQIAKQRPELSIHLGWQGRLAERMPGRSRTKRR